MKIVRPCEMNLSVEFVQIYGKIRPLSKRAQNDNTFSVTFGTLKCLISRGTSLFFDLETDCTRDVWRENQPHLFGPSGEAVQNRNIHCEPKRFSIGTETVTSENRARHSRLIDTDIIIEDSSKITLPNETAESITRILPRIIYE